VQLSLPCVGQNDMRASSSGDSFFKAFRHVKKETHSPTLGSKTTNQERRAKREERRAKQRIANVGRAAKMHVVRLTYESNEEQAILPTADKSLPRFNVGCSGWFYWHWRGSFYPDSLPPKNWFNHYAKRFKTVELNAPFYSWPTPGVVQTWNRQAGRRSFVYTVKVSELITHIKRFTGTRTLVRDFGHIANLLGARMGCFLFQLPPSFHYSRARLNRILLQLDPTQRNVVEFRHSSWWREEVFLAFRNTNTIFCSCSGPRLPTELIKTSSEVYVRFHGIKQWYRHDYTSDELAEWATKINESGAARVWAYFNNDRDCNAIKNARELLRQLQES
jgi:uncharacterized protein YecE (DUF72 family)